MPPDPLTIYTCTSKPDNFKPDGLWPCITNKSCHAVYCLLHKCTIAAMQSHCTLQLTIYFGNKETGYILCVG